MSATEKTGSLAAKLLTSVALLATSGAYAYWRDGLQPPASHIRAMPKAHVGPAAGKSPPSAPSVSAVPAPMLLAVPLDSPRPEKPAAPKLEASAEPPQQSPAESPPPAVAAPEVAAAPPPAEQTAIAETPPPRLRFAIADGDFIGDPADCVWGSVQVELVVKGGAITSVSFLQMPDHRRRSAEISDWVAIYLIREAIQEQSSEVDLISSATATSLAFQQAVANALSKAKK